MRVVFELENNYRKFEWQSTNGTGTPFYGFPSTLRCQNIVYLGWNVQNNISVSLILVPEYV